MVRQITSKVVGDDDNGRCSFVDSVLSTEMPLCEQMNSFKSGIYVSVHKLSYVCVLEPYLVAPPRHIITFNGRAFTRHYCRWDRVADSRCPHAQSCCEPQTRQTRQFCPVVLGQVKPLFSRRGALGRVARTQIRSPLVVNIPVCRWWFVSVRPCHFYSFRGTRTRVNEKAMRWERSLGMKGVRHLSVSNLVCVYCLYDTMTSSSSAH